MDEIKDVKSIKEVRIELIERIDYSDGTHEHQLHIHSRSNASMMFKVQSPTELMPRTIFLHFCPGCHLSWWEEAGVG